MMEGINHADRAHAVFSASGSATWLNCPGSIQAVHSMPEAPKKPVPSYTSEGILAHELADICLRGDKDADFYIGKDVDGDIIKKEMADYVQQYLDYVRSFIVKNCYFAAEERVDYSNMVPEGAGTLDATVIDYDNRICHIFDLKYGKGIAVSSFENTQAQLYALAIQNELGCLNLFDKFVIHIYQPRIFRDDPASVWEVSIEQIVEFGYYAKERAELALSENPERIPGEKQCQWCNYKPHCEELKNHTYNAVLDLFDDETIEATGKVQAKLIRDQLTMTPLEDQVEMHNRESLINTFMKAISANLHSLAMAGQKIPSMKVIRKTCNRKFTDEAEEVLVEAIGDAAFDKKLIGLGAAEKLAGKKVVAGITYKPEGELALVPEDHKSKEIIIKPIVEEFDNVDNEDEQ